MWCDVGRWCDGLVMGPDQLGSSHGIELGSIAASGVGLTDCVMSGIGCILCQNTSYIFK